MTRHAISTRSYLEDSGGGGSGSGGGGAGTGGTRLRPAATVHMKADYAPHGASSTALKRPAPKTAATQKKNTKKMRLDEEVAGA